MMVDSLAAALADAAARHGVPLRVATTAGAALRHDQADIPLVRLSDGHDGATVRMVRAPLPHEGGVTEARCVDATVEEGRLRPATLAWIERWTMDMAGVMRFGEALAAAGRTPDALPPWGARIDAAFAALVRASGLEPASVVAAMKWTRGQRGFEQVADWYTAERYLDRIHFRTATMEIGRRTIRFHEHEDRTAVWIGGPETLPHTLLQAAIGLPLGDVVSLPGGQRMPNIITDVGFEDDFIVLTAEPSTLLVPIPEAKEAK